MAYPVCVEHESGSRRIVVLDEPANGMAARTIQPDLAVDRIGQVAGVFTKPAGFAAHDFHSMRIDSRSKYFPPGLRPFTAGSTVTVIRASITLPRTSGGLAL